MNPNDVPCRVSADLRRHQQDQAHRFPPNEKRVEEAKAEIVEAILNGHGWRGHVLASAIDSYLNVMPPLLFERLSEVAVRLRYLATKPVDELDHIRADTQRWLREIVTAYVMPQWVEDRAAELAAED